MTIKQFIEKAIEGGWRPHNGTDYSQHKLTKAHKSIDHYAEKDDRSSRIDVRHMLLDPLAWQAVGKVEGWKYCLMDCAENGAPNYCGSQNPLNHQPRWRYEMHRLIDALAEGKTIEEALQEIN